MPDLSNSIWAQAERNNRAVRYRRRLRAAQFVAERTALIAAGWFLSALGIWAIVTWSCAGCGL